MPQTQREAIWPEWQQTTRRAMISSLSLSPHPPFPLSIVSLFPTPSSGPLFSFPSCSHLFSLLFLVLSLLSIISLSFPRSSKFSSLFLTLKHSGVPGQREYLPTTYTQAVRLLHYWCGVFVGLSSLLCNGDLVSPPRGSGAKRGREGGVRGDQGHKG